ncbi:MAG: hypothetical protein H5U36_03550 [Candidatus Caldatribacterium sp.]|nr:hypothetical protein [Candidatus Caldatribacterium sp.]
MRMIVAMALLVIAVPFVYLFVVTRFPESLFARGFIWIYLLVVLGVFLVHLVEKR